MSLSFLPALQTRLMPPLVILAAQGKMILYPDQILPNMQIALFERSPKYQAIGIGVPDIKRSARPHHLESIGKSTLQESHKLILLHVVIGNYVATGILHINVVWWICLQKVCHTPPPMSNSTSSRLVLSPTIKR